MVLQLMAWCAFRYSLRHFTQPCLGSFPCVILLPCISVNTDTGICFSLNTSLTFMDSFSCIAYFTVLFERCDPYLLSIMNNFNQPGSFPLPVIVLLH